VFERDGRLRVRCRRKLGAPPQLLQELAILWNTMIVKLLLALSCAGVAVGQQCYYSSGINSQFSVQVGGAPPNLRSHSHSHSQSHSHSPSYSPLTPNHRTTSKSRPSLFPFETTCSSSTSFPLLLSAVPLTLPSSTWSPSAAAAGYSRACPVSSSSTRRSG